MVYQPPSGTRDLFPLDVVQKSWIEAHLQHVFQSWGYHRIITSTLERLETLMAGGAVERSTVLQLQGLDEESLGLRPELTASIARAAATRMNAASSHPHRLYYNANVFRRPAPNTHNRQQEFYQAGVELLGVGGAIADAEVLLLLTDCMQRLGLSDLHLILGEAGLTRSLLSSFPDPVRDPVREAIAQLDRMTLEAMPLSDDLRTLALTLMDLRGKPEFVLQNVAALNLNPSQQDAVNNLKSLIELLHQSFGDLRPNLILDLSLIQTFDYYTGIVFELVHSSATGQQTLGQGGRYDQLLSLYHPQTLNIPGIGFSLTLEALQQVLLKTGQLPMQTPANHWLVVAQSPQVQAVAFSYAQTLRRSANLVRVELELTNGRSPDQIRAMAQHRRIQQIAWIQEDGQLNIEPINSFTTQLSFSQVLNEEKRD